MELAVLVEKWRNNEVRNTCLIVILSVSEESLL